VIRSIPFPSATTTPAAAEFASATTPATASGAFFPRPGDIDRQSTACQLFAMQRIDGFLGFLGRTHSYKTETAGASRGSVHHQIGLDNRAVRGKGILQVIFRDAETKVPYKQFCTHPILSCP
jgi:hypothetical protein